METVLACCLDAKTRTTLPKMKRQLTEKETAESRELAKKCMSDLETWL